MDTVAAQVEDAEQREEGQEEEDAEEDDEESAKKRQKKKTSTFYIDFTAEPIDRSVLFHLDHFYFSLFFFSTSKKIFFCLKLSVLNGLSKEPTFTVKAHMANPYGPPPSLTYTYTYTYTLHTTHCMHTTTQQKRGLCTIARSDNSVQSCSG